MCFMLWGSPARAQSDLVFLVSPSGDYIGNGNVYQTTDAFSFTGQSHSLTVGAFGFVFAFAAPGQDSFVLGAYNNAHRIPAQGSAPGIDVSGNGRSCSQECGNFDILEFHLDGTGNIDRLWLKFTNSCECLDAPMTGEIRYHSQSATNMTPPSLLTTPANQTVAVGNTAAFIVSAAGTSPIYYQWRLNGTNIPGETGTTLVLPNVQPGNAGSYSVLVVNGAGITNSAAAVLSIISTPACLNSPSGVVHWWQGDGRTADSVGNNVGVLSGGAGYSQGKVGLAYAFTNSSGFVTLPDSPVLNLGSADFTIELWAKFTSLGGSRAFISKDEGPGDTKKWIFWLHNGLLQFSLGQLDLGGGAFNPIPNRWHHVAVSRNGATFMFYVDGLLNSTDTSTAAIPTIQAPVTIGQAEGSYFQGGLEDEVTLYGRALSSSEIQSIYNADTAGKCRPTSPPFLVFQPRDQSIFARQSVTFDPLAGGTQPLSYQWIFNGLLVPGATNLSLTLTNVQSSQAGNYTLAVINPFGAVTSLMAHLTVLDTNTCLPPPAGMKSWWTGDGNTGDFSGTNHGLLAGGAVFVPGKVGQAFAFTNGTGFVQIPSSPDLDLGTNDFSIELWAQFTSLGGTRALIAKDDGSGGNSKWIFWLNNGLLQFQFGNSQPITMGSGGFQPVLNHWHHLAMTRSGSTFNFYIDGVLNSTGTSSAAIPPIQAPITIGQAEGTFFMGGLEDEVTIYSRALSTIEVRSIYDADAAGKCAPTIAPMLLNQPQGLTTFAGANLALSSFAIGSRPLYYQWLVNGTNIPLTNPSANNPLLNLTNLQPADSGSYSVVVTNSLGSTNSAGAQLTILPLGTCLPPPSGLINWWAGDGSTGDFAGTSIGQLGGNTFYAQGKAGLAFSFTLGNSYVQIPNQSSQAFGTNDFSIELWAMFTALGNRAFLAKDEGPGPTGKWIFWVFNNQLQFQFGRETATIVGSGAFTPVLNHWHHVAVTRKGSLFSFYVDGVLNSSATSSAPIPSINAPITIGQAEGGYFLDGMEDEVSIYNRALSGDEIQAIFSADSTGKCRPLTAPILITQPQGLTAFGGATVTFSVFATGSPLPTYQWRFNGNAIANATDRTLTLTNLQPGQAGNYSVVASNSVGSVSSFSAPLTVLTSGACLQPQANLLSWWTGDGGAGDSAGGNNGLLQGGASYAPAKVGLGFSFTNGNGFVQIPDAANQAFGTGDFSIELWAKFTSLGGNRAFISKDEGPGNANKWIFWLNNGQLQFQYGNSTAYVTGSGAFTPVLNQWHHVAVTRHGFQFTFYVDGAVSSTTTSTAAIPTINAPITIGQAEGGYFMGGMEDEVTIYRRALTASDVQAIYVADSAGKCRTLTSPVVIEQPQAETVFGGANVDFRILAAGNPPPYYQWQVNGTNLPNATDRTLSLTNLQPAQAGTYSVLVANTVATTNSTPALLTVLSTGSCLPPPPAMVGWWSGDGSTTDSAGTDTAVLSGGATYAPGKAGLGFSFSNPNSYVQIPDRPYQAFGSGDFTIELWAQFTSLGGARALISKDEGTGNTGKWIFWLNNGHLLFSLTGAEVDGGTFTPVLNQWHHLAVTRSGSTFTFYVDGSVNAIKLNSTTIPAINAPITIGQAEGNYFMGGTEDEVTIYSRALRATEIRAVYQADSVGKCRPVSAPVLVSQPTDQTIFTGGNLSFSALASGNPLPNYQWRFNGTNLPNATDRTLILTNVQFAQNGSYTVVATNPAGSATSTGALLTILLPGDCLPPPNGIVSWWAADGSASDSAGLNSATLINGATFAPGKVGLAFAFTNANSYVQVPDSSSLAFGTNDFSIELWAQFNSVTGSRALVSKDEGPGSVNKWIFWRNGNQLQFMFGSSPTVTMGSGTFIPVLNNWHHLAVTRSGSVFSFYVDGNLNSTTTSANAIPAINAPVTFGQAEGQYFQGGLEDEVSIYRRALSALEIQNLYLATAIGKCRNPTPPGLLSQPQGQTLAAGATVTLATLASGNPPPVYQWQVNTIDIPNATNRILAITNAQPTQSGNYSVRVSNPTGLTNSTPALVTIYSPVCFPPPTSLAGWWAGEGNTLDSAGTNHAGPFNIPTYSPGIVGQAFKFNGQQYLLILNRPPLNPTTNLTLEAWVNPTLPDSAPIIKKGGEGASPAHGYSLEFTNNGVALGIYLTNGWIYSANAPIPLNQWSHVAGTYDGAHLTIYVNGAPVGNPVPASGLIIPSGNQLHISHDPAASSRIFTGLIDEPSVYGSALSAMDIQSIYLAVYAGKCAVPVVPSIYLYPTNRQALAGSTTIFSVLPGGSQPLHYQWQFNGLDLSATANPSATNSALVLSGITGSQAGGYSVIVSNDLGMATSAVATLTVLFPPSITLQPVNESVIPGCSLLLNSTAAGTAPLTYQWRKDGTNLPFQTNATLPLLNIQTADFASYTMVATNIYGRATSDVAKVALDHPPVAGSTIVQRYPRGALKINTSTILENSADADGDPLSVTLLGASSLAGGAISLSGSNIIYLPPTGYTNADAFQYLLSDGHCGGTTVGEILVLVNPDTNPASRVVVALAPDGSAQVRFEGIPGQTYRIQSSGSLTAPDWREVATRTADLFGNYLFVDPPSTNSTTRYYRSVSP